MERTFVMVKPDGVQRRLVGDIVSRIERKGLRLAAMRLARLGGAQARELYKPHEGKPFCDTLVRFVTSSPVVVMAVEGHKAISVVRNLLGATFGFDAAPGTIRGDLGSSKGFNLVHGSDSAQSAQRELAIFFRDADFLAYEHADLGWVLEPPERA